MNKKVLKGALIALCMLLLLSGCGKENDSEIAAGEGETQQEEQKEKPDKNDLMSESGENCKLADDDKFGRIGNACITYEANSVSDTFGALGFEIDEYGKDGEHKVFTLERPEMVETKNYDPITVDVFSQDDENVTAEDLESKGFGSYKIDGTGYPISEYREYFPEINWAGGITWGSTMQEVRDVYGIPTRTFDFDYIEYEYRFEDSSSHSAGLTFVFEGDEGLEKVWFTIYQ